MTRWFRPGLPWRTGPPGQRDLSLQAVAFLAVRDAGDYPQIPWNMKTASRPPAKGDDMVNFMGKAGRSGHVPGKLVKARHFLAVLVGQPGRGPTGLRALIGADVCQDPRGIGADVLSGPASDNFGIARAVIRAALPMGFQVGLRVSLFLRAK